MCEHLFPSERYRFHDARCTSIAAELVEDLLEELSSRDHDWTQMTYYTEMLSLVTAHMVELRADDARPNPGATSPEG